MNYGLSDLRSSVERAALSGPGVSAWSVGMHIHHCCLAMIGICQSLVDSTPPPPRSQWSPITSLVFLSGRIPRGRGKSPDVAVPRQDVSQDELFRLLDRSEQILVEASQLDSGTWYRHFAFDVLDRDKSLKLIRIHNRHHLRIIADITAAVRQ